MTDISDQFRKIIMRYKRISYNLNVMQHSACLVQGSNHILKLRVY